MFDLATLTALRAMPSEEALKRLAIHCKTDPTFRPVKQGTTRRWHALTEVGEFELITSGPKWFDTRAKKGGGGAIDLAMHVLQLSFIDAVNRLAQMGSRHG